MTVHAWLVGPVGLVFAARVPREELELPVQEAAALAVEAGLAEFGARVRFRHPLVRSVVYRPAEVVRTRGRAERCGS